jgi:hypothetical protein
MVDCKDNVPGKGRGAWDDYVRTLGVPKRKEFRVRSQKSEIRKLKMF